jgi:hypothetical protein
MKKLLALLIAMLVIGSVFSGPVHINGPGISTENAAVFALSEGFVLADVVLPVIDRAVTENFGQVVAIYRFDVIDAVAGDSQGIYDELFGVTGSPFMITAALATNPDSKNFVLGDVSRSQEVISLRGHSKPAHTGNDMIFL